MNHLNTSRNFEIDGEDSGKENKKPSESSRLASHRLARTETAILETICTLQERLAAAVYLLT